MNPWLVLDVPDTATDDTIRGAWQRAVRECPPERDAARFQQVQEAYTAIRDARSRAAWHVRHGTPAADSPLGILEHYARLPGRLRIPGKVAFRQFLRACSTPPDAKT
jgi:hypothetical protein